MCVGFILNPFGHSRSSWIALNGTKNREYFSICSVQMVTVFEWRKKESNYAYKYVHKRILQMTIAYKCSQIGQAWKSKREWNFNAYNGHIHTHVSCDRIYLSQLNIKNTIHDYLMVRMQPTDKSWFIQRPKRSSSTMYVYMRLDKKNPAPAIEWEGMRKQTEKKPRTVNNISKFLNDWLHLIGSFAFDRFFPLSFFSPRRLLLLVLDGVVYVTLILCRLSIEQICNKSAVIWIAEMWVSRRWAKLNIKLSLTY